MTTVYGVTFIGARDQIEKQLKDRGDLAPEDAWAGSAYLAKVVSLIRDPLTLTPLILCRRFWIVSETCSAAPSTFRRGSRLARS